LLNVLPGNRKWTDQQLGHPQGVSEQQAKTRLPLVGTGSVTSLVVGDRRG
jgi:hypothetical protein